MERVVKYLNLIYKNRKFNTEFYQVKDISGVANTVAKVSPFAKVVIFSREIKDASLLQTILNEFSASGLKPIFYFLKENFNLNVENFAGAHNLPEDVRAVVILDGTSNFIGQYFANIRGVPCFYYLSEELARGILSDNIFLRVGENIDTVTLRLKRHVIICEKFILQEKTFLSLISGLSVLVDYKVNYFLGLMPENKNLYSLVKNSFISLLEVINEELSNQAVKCFFTLELFNKALNSKPFTFSSIEIFNFFDKKFMAGDAYFSAVNKLLNGKNQQDYIPDYRKTVGEVSFKLNIGLKEALDGIIKKCKIFSGKTEKVINLLKDEFNNIYKLFNRLKEKCARLGYNFERADESVKENIILSGSTPFGINALSLEI